MPSNRELRARGSDPHGIVGGEENVKAGVGDVSDVRVNVGGSRGRGIDTRRRAAPVTALDGLLVRLRDDGRILTERNGDVRGNGVCLSVVERHVRDAAVDRCVRCHGILTHRMIGDREEGARTADPNVVVGGEENVKAGVGDVTHVRVNVGGSRSGGVDTRGRAASVAALDGLLVRLRDDGRRTARTRQRNVRELRMRLAVGINNIGKAADKLRFGANRQIHVAAQHLPSNRELRA